MSNINLLREKFAVIDMQQQSEDITALGNRLTITVPGIETPLIIRGHSMHITLQFAASLLKQSSYVNHIENVETFFKWEETWQKTIAPFEAHYATQTWISVYFQGKMIFEDGFHNQFFDVVEQCEFKFPRTKDNEKRPITMAENAFKKMGRDVSIELESHVGFILDEKTNELRFAVIMRIPGQKATFTVRMYKDEKVERTPYSYIGMQLAANYIEAINMSVRMGFLEKEKGKSKEYMDMARRLGTLTRNIQQNEAQYDIKYRPERPAFSEIQEHTRDMAR